MYAVEKVTTSFEVVGQPLFSPDLAPSNYSLLQKLKDHLREERIVLQINELSRWNNLFAQEVIEMVKNELISSGTVLKHCQGWIKGINPRIINVFNDVSNLAWVQFGSAKLKCRLY